GASCVRVGTGPASHSAVNRRAGVSEKSLDGHCPATEDNNSLTCKCRVVRLPGSDNSRTVTVEPTDALTGGVNQRVREYDAVPERRGRLALGRRHRRAVHEGERRALAELLERQRRWALRPGSGAEQDRKSTRLNSSHV